MQSRAVKHKKTNIERCVLECEHHHERSSGMGGKKCPCVRPHLSNKVLQVILDLTDSRYVLPCQVLLDSSRLMGLDLYEGNDQIRF
jgi:hypothetical protein